MHRHNHNPELRTFVHKTSSYLISMKVKAFFSGIIYITLTAIENCHRLKQFLWKMYWKLGFNIFPDMESR